MNAKHYILGVDGGSSKTLALVSDLEGRILGAGRGRGSNWIGEDIDFPMNVVLDTSRRALQQAGLSSGDLEMGVFTLAGADWPEDHTLRQAFLQQAGIAGRVIVKNDSFGGLRAGLSRAYGVVIAAGSGNNAAAIAPDGREWAYGYYETYGGARDLAREAIVAVIRADDGRGQPTLLTEPVLSRLGFSSVEAMIRARVAGQIEVNRLLSLSPLVFAAAAQGDGVARAIIVKQGEALAEYAVALIRRFGMQDLELEVVLAGSVFKGEGSLLIDTITRAVLTAAPRAVITRPRFEPVVGSLLLAFDASGVPVTEAVIDNLIATMPGDPFFSTLDHLSVPTETGDAP